MFPDADRTVYRRRIEIVPGATGATGEMEDHHHHFRVRIIHDGATVGDVEATGVRAPWDTCATGADAIRSMIGLTIGEAGDPRAWGADRSVHCTHVADLALLTVRHALDVQPLRYDVRIWPAARRHRVAVLEHNGSEVMRWELDGPLIAGPSPWDGVALDRSVFLPWIRAGLDAVGVEQAMILRRAATISIGNAYDLDDFAVAADVHAADETCHTYRHEVALTARRVVGASRPLEWV